MTAPLSLTAKEFSKLFTSCVEGKRKRCEKMKTLASCVFLLGNNFFECVVFRTQSGGKIKVPTGAKVAITGKIRKLK